MKRNNNKLESSRLHSRVSKFGRENLRDQAFFWQPKKMPRASLSLLENVLLPEHCFQEDKRVGNKRPDKTDEGALWKESLGLQTSKT